MLFRVWGSLLTIVKNGRIFIIGIKPSLLPSFCGIDKINDIICLTGFLNFLSIRYLFLKAFVLSAVPTRRGGSKSPLRKDQNENDSSQTPNTANIQSRNPTRVVNNKHTKALRSKRVNSDSRVEEVQEASKPGKTIYNWTKWKQSWSRLKCAPWDPSNVFSQPYPPTLP